MSSRVTKLMISSAPARRDTKLAVMDYFRNSGLFELYGSTEAGWVTMLHPDEQFTKLGSVGRECVGSAPIRLLDADGNEVPDGEAGELYSCNPYTFDGYWKLPDKTAEAFRGDYCTVGDMARRDADGYIYLVDRKSNMIISGGENIYPSEVEALLGAHPSRCRDVAVIGLARREMGRAGACGGRPARRRGADARPSSSTGAGTASPATSGRARSRSSATQEMPRTATGKILHRLLREQHETGS